MSELLETVKVKEEKTFNISQTALTELSNMISEMPTKYGIQLIQFLQAEIKENVVSEDKPSKKTK